MESNPHIAREIRRLEEQYSFRPDSLVFGRLADLHRKAGNPERALEILEQGLSRHPRYLSAHVVRARCLRALDRPERAREAFEDVLHLDDENRVALRSLAELALERGDRAGARRHLEALLRSDPGDDESRAMLAELEEQVREDARRESEDDPRRHEEPRPGPPAEVPAAAPEEAAELQEQIRELDLSPRAAEEGEEDLATETLAGLYETQGFYREAVRMYERLLEERPGAEEIRQRLERARSALREADGGKGGDGSEESAAEHLRALLRGEARHPEAGGAG